MVTEVISKEKANKLSREGFIRFFGVDRATFSLIYYAVEINYKEKHKKRGRHSKLSIYDKVVIFLLYIRQYNPMEDYAVLYNVSKSVICESIHFVLNVLLKNKNFTLFGGKTVVQDSSENRLLDVTEIRIQRPKYNQRTKYSGKKKYHTMKIQIIRGAEIGFIYEIEIGPGSEHDFHLFKRTFEGSPNNVTYTVDLGYIGIDKIHLNSRVPKKSSKNHQLTEEEKEYNKELARDRIFIEHTNGWIKRFKILSTKFRNHLKFFPKFSVLLCGLYNCYVAN